MTELRIKEKFEKLKALYPDKWFQMMQVAGTILGGSGIYTTEELNFMLEDVMDKLARVMTNEIMSFDESLLLMNGLTREFLERGLDYLLEDINNDDQDDSVHT